MGLAAGAVSASGDVRKKRYLISFAQRKISLMFHVQALSVDQDIDEALHAVLLVE